MATPKWTTPAGFLGTITERQYSSFVLEASESPTFSIISGALPEGLSISSTGTIYGNAFSVGEVIRSKFVVRASNSSGVTDRTFIIDTEGPTEPEWVTPAGYLPVGQGNQSFIINRQFIDYKLNAIYDKLPDGQTLNYYIEENDGQLPPGISLTPDGRLVGQIQDSLGIDYTSSPIGGYDAEQYDAFPYDHVILQGSTPIFQKSKYIPKIYQFYVTVTDSAASSKRLFKIKVEDPSSLRVDTTLIDVDTSLYTADSSYLITPQWLSPANLGTVRANNNQVIQLSIYDPFPNIGPTYYDWDTPTLNIDGSPSQHPRNFSLTTSTGVLYATIPYQPAYSETYNFTVRIVKEDASTGATSYRDKTFTLTVRGDVVNTIEFISDSNIGTISPGYTSELSVKAKHTTEDIAIEYELIDGRLPSGLSLSSDGAIIGNVDYNSQTYFDFTLDNGKTTIDSKYFFTVKATDVYQKGATDKEFYITVVENDKTEYTKIYVAPSMNLSLRNLYRNFITDEIIFERGLIYRINDPSFGIQNSIKLIIEHGIEKLDLNNYAYSMRDYFYNKKFYFGDVKVAKAEDSLGNHVYDIVYIDIIDPIYKLQGAVTVGNITVYPNSVANFRAALEAISVEDSTVKVDEFFMPRFMRTVQDNTGAQLGFILAVPLCYATPNNGLKIKKRIDQSGFDFKSIDFEIDRLIVENTLDRNQTSYVLFPKRTITGSNPLEYLSTFVTENGEPLLTENGQILETEKFTEI